jgi:hypothetical protein
LEQTPLTYSEMLATFLSISAALGVIWTWWRNARLVKSEIKKEATDETVKESEMKRYFEKIDAQSKMITEMSESVKKLAADLVANQLAIGDLHRLRSQQADEIQDLQEGINKQYKIVQEMTISLATLRQLSENLLLSVNGLNDRQMQHTSQIARIEGLMEGRK